MLAGGFGLHLVTESWVSWLIGSGLNIVLHSAQFVTGEFWPNTDLNATLLLDVIMIYLTNNSYSSFIPQCCLILDSSWSEGVGYRYRFYSNFYSVVDTLFKRVLCMFSVGRSLQCQHAVRNEDIVTLWAGPWSLIGHNDVFVQWSSGLLWLFGWAWNLIGYSNIVGGDLSFLQ